MLLIRSAAALVTRLSQCDFRKAAHGSCCYYLFRFFYFFSVDFQIEAKAVLKLNI